MQGAPISGGEADRPAGAVREGAGAAASERHRPCRRCGALLPAHYLTCPLVRLPGTPRPPVRTARPARHSCLVIELTPDEARTAYLACRDAEAFRRWHTCNPCAQCRSAATGAYVRHARDLNLADGYARLHARLGGHVPYPVDGGLPG